ncbi:MAG: curlin repeat-containing protein [Balneolaceae bacterium]|nr:curlin repeat-containing protein [Balneolaceae bacterium]MCH8549669.1 curlin repeat-containing protein [Balneolaceae bacterium]
MKTLLTLLLVLLFSAGEILAQNNGRSEVMIPQAASFEHNEAVQQHSMRFATSLHDNAAMAGTAASLLSGFGNMASVLTIGSGNIAEIMQNGTGNVAGIIQFGDNNRTSVNQDGNSNLASINLIGNNNSLELNQIGDNNRYFNATFGSNIDMGTVNQSGQSTGIQIEGAAIPGLQISQTNNGGFPASANR